jgi:hypothetical protein
MALAVLSGRIIALWRRGRPLDGPRAILLVVGLTGDWAMVVATAFDVSLAAMDQVNDALRMGARGESRGRFALEAIVAGVVLGCGLVFLARHDTESGHLPILGALAVLAVWSGITRGRSIVWEWTPRRLAWVGASAWAIPLAALAAAVVPGFPPRIGEPLVARCRFAAVPIDDLERLAAWCRDHTPRSARFIGPPGPKTFRLWSLRSLAFNRAASPYHAEGLADWSARFRDHVGFDGASSDFVRAYQGDRHGLERRYDAMSDAERADLAIRNGATHILARRPSAQSNGPLELLHVEGRYAVYRLRPLEQAAREETLAGTPPG